MIRELVKDEAILSQPCEAAVAEDAPVAQDLIDTVLEQEDGACLAANQIGVTKAIVVYLDDRRTPHVLYNPKIVLGLRPTLTVEGCLTRDEISQVRRYDKIKLSFDELVDGALLPRRRDYHGWVAQMIQHMVDHCNGKLV